MSTEENKRLLRTAYTGEGDGPDLLTLLADDATYTFFGEHSLATTFEGKQAIIDGLFTSIAETLEDGIKLEIHNMIAEGDQVVFEAYGTARTNKGVDYNNTYCMVVRMCDGQIASVREYLDTGLVSRVFG